MIHALKISFICLHMRQVKLREVAGGHGEIKSRTMVYTPFPANSWPVLCRSCGARMPRSSDPSIQKQNRKDAQTRYVAIAVQGGKQDKGTAQV